MYSIIVHTLKSSPVNHIGFHQIVSDNGTLLLFLLLLLFNRLVCTAVRRMFFRFKKRIAALYLRGKNVVRTKKLHKCLKFYEKIDA